MKKFLAEVIGTFILSIVVLSAVSADNPPFAVPVMAGFSLMIIVYLLGSVSGAHVNPAVTLGLWWANQIDLKTLIKYIIAQISGALIARWVAIRFFKLEWAVNLNNSVNVVWGEIVGTAILTMAVSIVVFSQSKTHLSGVIIGGSLFLGAFVASNISNGILNPAVAMAINSSSIYYLASPLIGGIIGVQIGKFFRN